MSDNQTSQEETRAALLNEYDALSTNYSLARRRYAAAPIVAHQEKAQAGVRTTGAALDNFVRSLMDRVCAAEAHSLTFRSYRPFGAYVERNDGTTEFRRLGEAHSLSYVAGKWWPLYSGPVWTEEELKAALFEARTRA